MNESPTPLVPAKAGTQFSSHDALIFANASILRRDWIPAFAGMSGGRKFLAGSKTGVERPVGERLIHPTQIAAVPSAAKARSQFSLCRANEGSPTREPFSFS